MFPHGNYLIATSRLHPGLDGGQTVALLRRARHFREVGGASPLLLSFDFAPQRTDELLEFQRMGLADERTVFRNLYQDARGDPSWLFDAARPLLKAHGAPWQLEMNDGPAAMMKIEPFGRRVGCEKQ